jgi:CBS domain-containing protein
MAVVADHMSRDLLVVEPGTTLDEAARRMAERNVGTVLALEGDRLVGILTERDVLRAVAAGYTGSDPVSRWMTHHPETVEASDTTAHAAVLMIHGGFRHLPVVEAGGGVVGILSIRDLVRLTLDDEAPRGV